MNQSSNPGESRDFPPTRWSLVLSARQRSEQSRQALEALCQRYWYPLYAYVRRRGQSPQEAEDLTQGFFLHLLEHDGLARAQADKGRFRTFLLSSLRNYVINEWNVARAAKRGGGHKPLPIDLAAAERRYSLEPAHGLTPDRLFERRWARILIAEVLEALAKRYKEEGKERVFAVLNPFLIDDPGISQAAAAAELGMNTAAVKVAVHRLRRRFGEMLRDAVADTVQSPDQVDDELHTLMTVFRP